MWIVSPTLWWVWTDFHKVEVRVHSAYLHLLPFWSLGAQLGLEMFQIQIALMGLLLLLRNFVVLWDAQMCGLYLPGLYEMSRCVDWICLVSHCLFPGSWKSYCHDGSAGELQRGFSYTCSQIPILQWKLEMDMALLSHRLWDFHLLSSTIFFFLNLLYRN